MAGWTYARRTYHESPLLRWGVVRGDEGWYPFLLEPGTHHIPWARGRLDKAEAKKQARQQLQARVERYGGDWDIQTQYEEWEHRQGREAVHKKQGRIKRVAGGGFSGGGFEAPDETMRGEGARAVWEEALRDMRKSTSYPVPSRVHRWWGTWRAECGRFMQRYAKRYPMDFHEGGQSALDLDEDTPFHLYLTFTGEGSGIWDGRWDAYMTDAGLNRLMRAARGERGVRGLHRSADLLKSAIYRAAARA